MKDKVTVRLTGIHTRAGSRSERIETKAEGSCRTLPDGYEIVYEDRSAGEKDSITNTLRVCSGRLEMIRSGAYGSHMIFEEENEHHTDYRTPYGVMDMVIRTDRLVIAEKQDGIRVETEYTLEMNGQELSQSLIVLEIA